MMRCRMSGDPEICMEKKNDDIKDTLPDTDESSLLTSEPDRASVRDNASDDGVKCAETEEGISLRYENKRQVAKGGLLGFFIGLAIIVPGVSGSAVAIILRFYEKLLYALGNIFKKFGKCIRFLLPILAGAVVGVVLGFFGVRFLLDLLPFAIVALFAGLMLGAFPSVKDQVKGEKLTPLRAVLFVVGFAVPVAISAVSIYARAGEAPLEGLKFYHYILFVVLGYIVAITQLVPGLSATALLMTFGYFTPLVNSVSITYWTNDPSVFLVYLCLIAGFVAGLLTVSKFMSVLIDRRRAPTFYTVAGLSLGSVASMFFNPEIVNVYRSWTPGASMYVDICLGAVLFIAGVALAYIFVRYERKHKDKI